MAHFVLAPSGSHGDVHPFLAIGLALKARGHDVTMTTSAHFEGLARAAGFAFDAVGTEQDFQHAINNPDLWHPTRALKVLFGGEQFRRTFRESYHHLATRAAAGKTVIVAGSLSLAARLVHEKLGTPLVTVHLQPMAYPSVSDPPMMSNLRPRSWWPRWWIRTMYWIGDRKFVDPLLMPPVNEFRRELGLEPMKRIWGPWRHSPQCILGLYPEWYGPASDLPAHMERVGFVRFDQSDTAAVSPDLERFLRSGGPPVVVSFGSAMKTGRVYFEAAVQACTSLNRRVLILARGGEQIPPLPPGSLHVEYAPFSQVFPYAGAVIHHGGVGTSAQALAAGVPQLVMPLAFDQFDNAARLIKLGVARSVPATRFTAQTATVALKELLADSNTLPACANVKLKMNHDPLPRIVATLESQIT